MKWDFELSDFLNRMRLATRIWKRRDPVSQYLWTAFSDDTKKLFEELAGPLAALVENPLIAALIVELNKVLERSDLYEPARFADIRLREEVTSLLEGQPLTSDDQLLLNRMLLESAYPDDIVRSGQIKGLAAEIIHFFAKEHLIVDAEGKQAPPKTLRDFLDVCPDYHDQKHPHLGFEIRKWCQNLIAEGQLYPGGFDPQQRVPLNERFFSDQLIRNMAVYGSYEFAAFGIPKILQHFSSSVVKLQVSINGRPGTGTGFLIEDGRIVTAAHCVPVGATVQIVGWDASKSPVSRVVTFNNPLAIKSTRGKIDIAILEFERDPFPKTPKFKLWSDAALEDVLAMGYPPLKGFKSGLIASRGAMISKEMSDTRKELMIIFSATIKKGNSGGPLVNRLGRVVGIVTNLLTVAESDLQKLGYGLAFPAQLILDLLNLIKGKEVANRTIFPIQFSTPENAITILT